MSCFNKVILMGNLTRDPDLRYGQSGSPMVRVGLAVNRKRKNKEGEYAEEASFFDLKFFGSRAEAFAQHFEKGKPVLIEGQLRSWTAESDDGKKRGVEVLVDRWYFLPRGRRESEELAA